MTQKQKRAVAIITTLYASALLLPTPIWEHKHPIVLVLITTLVAAVIYNLAEML